MEIKNITVYTKGRILRSSYYFASKQMALWITLPIGTVIVYFVALMQIMFGELNLFFMMACLFFTLLDIIIPLMLFVFLPRTVIKQTKSLNATLEYTFTDDEIILNVTKSDLLEEKTTMKYPMLLKAEKNKNELYLYIQLHNAFVVDLSKMSEEDKAALKDALKSNLQKVKWK